MTDAAEAPLPVYFDALDNGYRAYAAALRRRLAACRERHRLEDKKKKPPAGPGGKPHWFDWSGVEISPSALQGWWDNPADGGGSGGGL